MFCVTLVSDRRRISGRCINKVTHHKASFNSSADYHHENLIAGAALTICSSIITLAALKVLNVGPLSNIAQGSNSQLVSTYHLF